MSKFNFIASDSSLPEVHLTNVKRMTVKELKKLNPQARSPIPLDEMDENLEVLYCESEEDMEGLVISFCDNPPDNLDKHIKKKYVYWLKYEYKQKYVTQLLEYLHQNMINHQQIEIWSILFGNKDKIYKVRNIEQIKLSELTEDHLMKISSQEMCIRITG